MTRDFVADAIDRVLADPNVSPRFKRYIAESRIAEANRIIACQVHTLAIAHSALLAAERVAIENRASALEIIRAAIARIEGRS